MVMLAQPLHVSEEHSSLDRTIADVTVTCLEPEKFLVVASDIIHRRIEPLISARRRRGG